MEHKSRYDGVTLTPEQLVEAINNYRAANPAVGSAAANPVSEPGKEAGIVLPEPAAALQAKTEKQPSVPAEPLPISSLPEAAPEPAQESQKTDGGSAVGGLIAALKGLLAELEGNAGKLDAPASAPAEEPVQEKAPVSAPEPVPAASPEEPKENGSGTQKDLPSPAGGSCPQDGGAKHGKTQVNADSAGEDFAEKLRVCRVGDRLNMDGLEAMSVIEAKKAVIRKVYPEMRLDGMDDACIHGAFEVASQNAANRKGAPGNMRRLLGGNAEGIRLDSKDERGADEARAAMIDRMLNRNEGGNE